jgi:hypothetical protein
MGTPETALVLSALIEKCTSLYETKAYPLTQLSV